MKKSLLLIVFLFATVSFSRAGELTVEVAAVARSVENLIPVGVADKYPSSVGKLYCYSKITGGDGKSIKHIWYLNDKKLGETTLAIKSKSYRTYSVETIPSHAKGGGRCDVAAEDGKVLKSVEFVIE